MPTPVDARANLHTADCYGQPLGVRCRACERRVLVPLDRIGAQIRTSPNSGLASVSTSSHPTGNPSIETTVSTEAFAI